MKNTIEIITNILSEKIMVPMERLVEVNFDKPLVGKVMNLDAIDMVYLLCEVEKQFDIKIQQEDIIKYRFNTITDILNIVEKYKVNV